MRTFGGPELQLGVNVPQMPPRHDLPAGQAAPQDPQFAGSIDVLTHVPPQTDGADVGQLQVPPEHVRPPVHVEVALVHAPQCVESVLVSMHLPVPQSTVPPLQTSWHVPATQVLPVVVQSLPQDPQFFESLLLSLQTAGVPHAMKPVPHEAVHDVTPAVVLHTSPAAHFLPQTPQLLMSDVMSRHVPLQFVRPDPQLV